jgi:membrane-bound lytic murein transglycosylase B
MRDQRSTIVVPWRKIRAALPAVALIGAGMTFAAPVAPRDILGVAVSNNSSAVVVPPTALTMQAVLSPTQQHPFTGSAPKASDQARQGSVPASFVAALVLPVGTQPESSGAVALDNNGIPVRALQAYRKAASLVDAADATCHIDWALLAAIGRVESNHARFGGNQLDLAGVAQPGIIGIALDGRNGTARIMDSDRGRLDRDTVYDRAVGPMQFIPSTWRVVGVDADGDGVKNPQDMADAATSTGIYLCSGPGDLSRPSDLRAAVMRYNASDSYVRTVTAIADAYRHGVRALPASDLPAANSALTTSDAAQAAPVPAAPVKAARIPAAAAPAAPAPHAAPAPVAPIPAAPVAPIPAAPVAPIPAAPVAPIPAAPVAPIPAAPVAPIPASPIPTAPDACLPVSAGPEPSVPGPALPVPALPVLPKTDPALPVPSAPVPAAPAVPVPSKTDPALPVPQVPLPALTVPGSTPTVGVGSSAPLAQEICTVAR